MAKNSGWEDLPPINQTPADTGKWEDLEPIKMGMSVIPQQTAPGEVTTATSAYGQMKSDEEALFSPDALRITPQRLPKSVEDEYYNFISQNKKNENFSQKDIDTFWTSRGYAPMAAGDEFISAVRKGSDTGKIDYSPWDEAQQGLEDARMKRAMEDFSKQAYEGDYASAVDEGAQYGFWGITSRTLKDWFDTNKDALKQEYPNASDEELERLSDQDIIRRARAARQYYQEENKDSAWAPWLAGQFTSAIDPTAFIAPGATAGGRVAAQSGIQMLTQGAFEGIDAAQGLPSGQAGENILLAGALGAGMQGLVEIGGKLYRRVRGPQGEVLEEVAPDQIQEAPSELNQRIEQKTAELEELDAQSAAPLNPPGEVSDALVQLRKIANDMHLDAEIEGGKYPLAQLVAIHKKVDEGLNAGRFSGADLEEATNIKAFLDEAIYWRDQAENGITPPEVAPVQPNRGAGDVQRAANDEAELPASDRGDGQEPPSEPPSGGGRDGGDEPPIDRGELLDRLTESLKVANKASAETRALRTEERRKRLQEVAQTRQFTSGEKGYYAEKSKLSGTLPKADLEPIRDNFTAREVDELFEIVKEKDGLYGNTRAALVKLLGGEIPSKREIDLLSEVFPNEFVKEVLKKRTRGRKLLDFAGNALNLPRSLMSTFDLSAPFRQGVFLVGSKAFWKNWSTMFKSFGSERAYKAVMDDIEARPNYQLMEEAGLDFTKTGLDLTRREEQFMSQWAEKIPVIGRGVKASERAFTGFLNKLRADTFDRLAQLHEQANGRPMSEKELKDTAWFINSATGRGDLGRFNQAAPILNGLFFSPRLMASRVNLLRPDNYVRLSPTVRREALKSLLSFGGIALTIASLAQAGGMKVEGDPRSSDFAKLKTGNTRYDILGGFGQYLTLGARLATDETKKMNGDIQELGKKYGSDTRLDVLMKFLMNKESPVASFVTDYLRGSNAIGEPFELKTAVAQRFIPLFFQDVKKMMDEYGPLGAAMAAPGLFGVGVQNYSNEKSRDMFGRDDSDETPKDAVDTEVERLSEPLKGELIGKPKKSIYVGKDENGETQNRELTPEEYDEYTYLSGQYILETIRTEMNTPEWELMSDNDKRDVIRDIAKDMRKQAREDLFTPQTKEETEGWKDL